MNRMLVCLAAWILLSGPDSSFSAEWPVLIVYSSGEPGKTISELSSLETDAVSSATPRSLNCRILAECVGSAFRLEACSVRVVPADSIRHHTELLGRSILVFIMPARFWNVPWEMKRLLDVHLGAVYVGGRPEFKKTVIGGIAMAEIRESADSALQAFGRALGDCGVGFAAVEVFLTSDRAEDHTFTAKIRRFADLLIARLAQD